MRRPGHSSDGYPRNGFSLPEMLVVIAVIGILASILVPIVSNVQSGSKSSVAQSQMNILNQAVMKFNEINWELVLGPDPDPSNVDEELAIAHSLQYRTTDASSSSGPFLSQSLDLPTSSDTSKHRAQWNGRMFQIIDIGTAGTGLDLLSIRDSGTNYVFPSGYEPVGAP